MAKARVGAALLAAGSSRRFGEADKLAQPFRGTLLGARSASAIPTARLVKGGYHVIASKLDHPCRNAWEKSGCGLALNDDAAQGIGTSVRIAAQIATSAGYDALLITLADMPLVPRAHFEALIDAYRGPGDIICSSPIRSAGSGAPMPPAIFGSDHFPALLDVSPENGARNLLRAGRVITCPPKWLKDIDTREDLSGLD